MKAMNIGTCKLGWPFSVLLVCAILCGGCVVRRGRDFGSYVGAPEYVPLVRVFHVQPDMRPTKDSTLLILPPLGAISESEAVDLRHQLLQQSYKYFGYRTTDVDPKGTLLEGYISPENLTPVPGIFDFNETSRIGRLLRVSHVMCVWVRELRVYPPQRVALYLAVVDSQSGTVVVEMEAVYDASEQRVVMALKDYLQARRSRPYDESSLEVMLRSPGEYQAFVAAECCRVLAKELRY